MENTITPTGAKALKQMLLGQIEIFDEMITLMTGKEEHPLSEILQSQNNTIKGQKEIIKDQREKLTKCGSDISAFKSAKETLEYYIEERNITIKKQREEIEALKEELSNARSEDRIFCGDFSLVKENVANGNDTFSICKKEDSFISTGKLISEADISKAFQKLYFRTEEKRSCENCRQQATINGYDIVDPCMCCSDHSNYNPKK